MAVKTVRAKVNGTWHNLTYNSASGKWEGRITAPGATSYHQPGGYYNMEIEATERSLCPGVGVAHRQERGMQP